MSKILIIGNGFDLFHHLPTKYGHFISVMKSIEKNTFSKDILFKDLFGSFFKDENEIDYKLIVENYKVDEFKFEEDKINDLKVLLQRNLWYKYFKNILEIETWIDFEVEVESFLKEISVLLKSETPQSKKINFFREISINYSDFNLFGIIEQKLEDREVFSITEKYLDKRKLGIKSKNILRDLSSSFEDFIVIFNRYLVDVVGVFYTKIKQKESIPFHLLNEIYTFNYTPSLEIFYNIDKSKVVYLHGEINGDDNIQNIVLGISDISTDIKTSKMFNFTKYYQKVNNKSNKKFIEVPKELKKSLSETIFYIIGHSLDESDKEYIVDLFKFLEFDHDKYSKICIFCHNKKDQENKLKNLLSIIDKGVIVEMNRTGRLYFVELNAESIKNQFSKETYKYRQYV